MTLLVLAVTLAVVLCILVYSSTAHSFFKYVGVVLAATVMLIVWNEINSYAGIAYDGYPQGEFYVAAEPEVVGSGLRQYTLLVVFSVDRQKFMLYRFPYDREQHTDIGEPGRRMQLVDQQFEFVHSLPEGQK